MTLPRKEATHIHIQLSEPDGSSKVLTALSMFASLEDNDGVVSLSFKPVFNDAGQLYKLVTNEKEGSPSMPLNKIKREQSMVVNGKVTVAVIKEFISNLDDDSAVEIVTVQPRDQRDSSYTTFKASL